MTSMHNNNFLFWILLWCFILYYNVTILNEISLKLIIIILSYWTIIIIVYEKLVVSILLIKP